jgi:hypothetical protein
MPAPQHQKSFVLTVAESKRLIARSLKWHPLVKNALNNGIVAVAKGTTNSYIVEELTGQSIEKPLFCTGTTKPSAGAGDWARTANELPDLVLRKGQRVEDVNATEIVDEMGPGDVFIKGANALNYDLGQAGILIGHPTGGTIGAAIGTVVARRATLLLPVGLEKNIPGDINEAYGGLVAAGANGSGPTLWPVTGMIYTEIEAAQNVSGATARLIAAGGIAGAEGSVRISVHGAPDQVDRAEGFIKDCQGEPPFVWPV